MKGLDNGAKMYCVDPRRTSSSKFADLWLGIDVGTDIALANAIAREIIHAGLVNTEFVAHSTRGYDEFAAAVEPYTLERRRRDHRCARRCDPRTRALLRHRRQVADPVDARHHRASQRGRQRAVALQPRTADRSHRSLGFGSGPPAWTEQRAGRWRHGCAAEQAARLPRPDERRAARQVRSRLRDAAEPGRRYPPHADVRSNGTRRDDRGVRGRGESGRLRSRHRTRPQDVAWTRLPRRAGHLHDAYSRDGRRRLPGVGRLGRIRRHRHVVRTTRAAGARRRHASRRSTPRHRHHGRPR